MTNPRYTLYIREQRNISGELEEN